VTPFMRALSEFPRRIYHGAPLSTTELDPWMPQVCQRRFCDMCDGSLIGV